MKKFSQNDDKVNAVRDSFESQPFMKTLGAELLSVGQGKCQIKVPFDVSLTQQHGYFHAGVIGTIADNTAGYAAYSLMAPDSGVLTVEFKLNLLNPGKGDYLLAKAEVLKNGRTLKVCESKVYAYVGQEETLCAAALVTLMELKAN